MIYKPCPKCKRLIAQGLTYCQDCQPIADQQYAEYRKLKQKRYNQNRNKKYKSFYNSKSWKTLSRAKLISVNYQCEAHVDNACTGLAVEVHHVKPIQTLDGWNRRLDWDNLEAVCTHCHNMRHPEKSRKHDPDVIDLRTLKK